VKIIWLLSLLIPGTMFGQNISAIWANDGGDKVTRDELRATNHTENLTGKVLNRTWDGSNISISGAQNEIVSFNLVLEAGKSAASKVSVTFDTLTGPNGQAIHSIAATGDGVFSWVNRPIELFYVRYLQIKGLSVFGYNGQIEPTIPARFKSTSTPPLWNNRPDHDKLYPDILVPLELVPTFDIASGQNQSVWGDVYIPKGTAPGVYTGTVSVKENGVATKSVPVRLTVYNFALPDVQAAKVMMAYSQATINKDWFGELYIAPEKSRAAPIRDKYFQLMHRHKVDLIGDAPSSTDAPVAEDIPRIKGTLYTAKNGYDGPGVSVPSSVWSIGTYGTWTWKDGNESVMRGHANGWATWFSKNAPQTTPFLYLLDEPHSDADLAKVNQWSQWLKNNPGPGMGLAAFATIEAQIAKAKTPDLGIDCTPGLFGNPTAIAAGYAYFKSTPGKQLWGYNGVRPAAGTFDIEDDGIALRQLPWAQFKMGVGHWFYWMINDAAVSFTKAATFNPVASTNPITGEYGSSNGEGSLVYSGTTLSDPANSYKVNGPFSSVRLKMMRRGIQDVDYLTLASKINPAAVNALVSQVVPKTLWETPVNNLNDPSWTTASISWSSNPDVWEAARAQLAAIIGGASK
jgi:Domain of unknown function (DUF4091)/Family of unknown function (DUF6067)